MAWGRVLLVLGLAATCAPARGFEGSAQPLSDAGATVGSEVEAVPALYGPHVPFNADFDRRATAVSPADGCSMLTTDQSALHNATAIFDLSSSCLALDAALRAQQRGAAAALFVDEDGARLRRSNLGFLSHQSPRVHELHIPVMLVGHAARSALRAASRLRLKLRAYELADGVPHQHSLEAERDAFFTYTLASATNMTVVVFAQTGDPDIYGNRGAALGDVQLPPETYVAQYRAAHAGDDLLTISAAPASAYVFGVNAHETTSFTIQLATGSHELELPSGQPTRVTLRRGQYRYLKHSVGNGRSAPRVRFLLTEYTGRARMWVCSRLVPNPDAHDPDGACRWGLELSQDARIVDIPASDPHAARPGEAYHVVLLATTNTSASVVAVRDSEAVSLVDGSPQVGRVGPSTRTNTYTLHRNASAALEVLVQPTVGDLIARVADGSREWTLGQNQSYRLYKGAEELHGERVTVTVSALGPDFGTAQYSLTASSGGMAITLEDGVPHLETVGAGGWEVFRVYVQDPFTDLSVIVTPLSGNPDVYASHVHERPNATHHEFAATSTGRDVITIAHTSAPMRACTADADAGCVFFVAVEGAAEDGSTSTFTISAQISVANSGLHVDEPAAVAGSLVFSNAVFGPPLLFEEPSRALAAVEPRDGCAELSARSLADKVALVERGTCMFTEKVLHAQQKGASAVIITNDVDGPPVPMGVADPADASALHIPAVMVSRADGERLRAQLAAGRTVQVTLEQPGDRPVVLVDGMPQHGSLAAHQMKYFKFDVGAGHADVTFTVTPEVGDPDLFVSIDGFPPTQSHSDWASTYSGEDALTVSHTDAMYCTECTYLVGVYGWTSTNFSIVASTSAAIISLELGMPLTEFVPAGGAEFFKVVRYDPGAALRIVCTPITGDPDLCVSTTTERPSSEDDTCTWVSGDWGADSIVISASDPHSSTGPFYIAVEGYSNTTFTLLVSQVSPASLQTLVAGRPQSVALAEDEWQYFRFVAPANASAVSFSTTPEFGDPDVYANAGVADLPDRSSYHFHSAGMGVDVVSARHGDPRFCASCTYIVGVFGFSETNFTLLATADVDSGGSGRAGETMTLLTDRRPLEGVVAESAYRYYRFPVDFTDRAVNVTVTAFSGDPDIFASFELTHPSAQQHTFSSTLIGLDHLVVSHFSPHFCTSGNCSLYIAVYGATESRYTIVAAQYNESRLMLVDGQPQHSMLVEDAWQHYSYTPARYSSVVRFSVTPSFGDPDLYVSTRGPPSDDSYEFSSAAGGGDEIVVTPASVHWCRPPCVYHVGVKAWTATNYTIVASANATQIVLEDGVPHVGSVQRNATQFFKIYVEDAGSDLDLIATPLTGNPDLFVSHVHARPNGTHHEFKSTSRERDVVHVEHTDAAMRDCTAGGARCVFYVSVYGAGNATSSFQLIGTLHTSNRGLRVDSPADVAGEYANRAATFGEAAPFEGESMRLVATSPEDACSELSGAPAALAGKIALVRRGECVFVEKVRRAQRAGAAGVIVDNSAGTVGALFMATPEGEEMAAADVSIPSVMVSADDGARMRAALGRGAVHVTLQQPGDRPRMLVEGLPQHGTSRPYEMVYYKMYVGDHHHDVSFSLTAEVGTLDLYVRASTSADGLPPTQTHHDWAARSPADSVTVRVSEANFCDHCYYYVGVFGQTAANYSIVGATSEATLTLQLNMPTTEHLETDEYEYFKVVLPDRSHAVRITITPITGDPDMYASTSVRQPNATHHTWSANAFGEDTLYITGFEPDDEAVYVGVTAFANSTFTILASAGEDECTTLVSGQPQQLSVPSGDFRCFTISVGEDATQLTVGATPAFGDPDLYITNDGLRPSEYHFQWHSTRTGGDEVHVDTRSGRGCVGCRYTVGVHAFTATNLTLQATVSTNASHVGHRILSEGRPLVTTIDAGQTAFFEYPLDSDAHDLDVRFSRFSGVAHLYASFATPTPGPAGAQWDVLSALFNANTGFTVARDDPRRWACAGQPPCPLYLAVEAPQPFNATVSLLIAEASEVAVVSLVDGRPQNDNLDSGLYRYYNVTVSSAEATSLSVAVTALSGDPDLFVSNDGTLPTAEHAMWSQTYSGGDSLRISSTDVHWCYDCKFTIGVFAWTASNYTLVAAVGTEARAPAVTLQDGTPRTDSIVGAAGDARFYAFYVDSRDASVTVTVTPFVGDPDILASFNDTRPTWDSSGHVFSSTAAGADVLRISHFDPHFCPRVPCMLYIGVSAYSGNSTYSIVVTQSDETALTLVDGVPQRRSLRAGEWQYFTYAVGDAPRRVSFTVTPSFGDPDLYVTSDGTFPSEEQYTWMRSSSGGDSISVSEDDPHWCARCSYHIGVRAFSATNFSLTASTANVLTLLEDGVPLLDAVGDAEWAHFRVYVDEPDTDLLVLLTPMGGNPDLFVSHVHARPNGTHCEFNSTSNGRDLVRVSHNSAAMRDCTRDGAPKRCTFYASVYGAGPSSFAIIAELQRVRAGLRVDEPEPIAGNLLFTPAVFGPALPFEGESRVVKTVTPRDACAEIRGVSLANQIALVDRGGCFFTNKTRNAQAAGAAAVIVVNNEPGEAVRMGATSTAEAAGQRIPAVMISLDDGAILRTRIEMGERVRVTLQQPGDRPVTLVDGLPQRGQVEAHEMKYYKFGVGEGHADVTFTVTPEVGDPDLFVTAGETPPTQSQHDWAASRSGEDAVTIRAGEPRACTACTYIVGVYGWTPSNFSVVASTAAAVITLEMGLPLTEQLSAHETETFRVLVGPGSSGLQLALTALTGDPDMYVSTSAQRPSAEEHTWSSVASGDDVLTILPTDEHFLPDGGVYYVSVSAFSNTTFTISASVSSDLWLLHGRPQRMSLAPSQWQYYHFYAAAGQSEITIVCTPSFGDPDMYVSAGYDHPTREAHTWKATASGGDLLTISSADPAWCAPPCAYTVGVYAWAATNFTVVAIGDNATAAAHAGRCVGSREMDLIAGVAVYGVAAANGTRCYRVQVDTFAQPVRVALTAFSGVARIDAGFAPASGAPSERASALSSSTGSSLTLVPDCEPGGGGGGGAQLGGCMLHITLTALSDCSFSLSASQDETTRAVALVGGRPQYGTLSASSWAYYSFAAPARGGGGGAVPITIALMPLFGDPNMYVSAAGGATPTESAHTWASSAAGGDYLLIGADDPHACAGACTYTIGVRAGSDTNYSITAHAHGEVVTLQEGVPLTGLAPARACAHFVLRASQPHSAVLVSLTALSGHPVIYVADRPQPSPANHLPNGTMAVRSSSAELRVPLDESRAVDSYVGVCAGADALPARFVLGARLHADEPPRLLDGQPFASAVGTSIASFRIAVGPHAERLQVVATPRSGDLSLMISRRGEGHDAPSAGAAAYDRATWRSHTPGVNSVGAWHTDSGWCNDCELVISVQGHPAANFTLLATLERAYTLRDGEPQLAELTLLGEARHSSRSAYFAFSVDQPVGFAVIVTVYAGEPDVFVSATDPRPSASSFTWQPASAFDQGAGGIRQVVVSPDDPAFCSACTYYVAVRAYASCRVAVTAVSDSSATVALMNGLPVKQAAAGGEYRYYTFDLAEGDGDMTVSVQPEVGQLDLDIYVTADGSLPSRDHWQWVSALRLDDEDQVTVRSSDAHYCAGCTYNIAVFGEAASTYTIAATTSRGTTLLPIGLTSQQSVAQGAAAFMVAQLDPQGEEVSVAVVSRRAPIRVYLSTVNPQPSEAFHKAQFDAEPLGAVGRYVLSARTLKQWCPPAVLSGGFCPLYIGASSDAAEAAAFSITVAQGGGTVLIPGLPQASAVVDARPTFFSFGVPGGEKVDASVSVSLGVDGGRDGGAGLVRVLVRKERFAEERADAHWSAHAQIQHHAVVSVDIAADDPKACADCTYYVTVLTSSGQPVPFDVTVSNARGHTLLTRGALVRSTVERDESALFKTYTYAGWDKDLVITVTPCSGDPDLYASDMVPRPSKDNYKFAHAEVNHVESLHLSARDDRLGDVLYLSVFGALSSSFTIGADDHAAGGSALGHGEEGALLALSEPSASAVAVSWAAAVPPEGVEPASISYELLLAEHAADKRVPVLFTQCGIDESARLIGNLTGRDADREGRLSSKVKKLQPGTKYQVNVRATLPSGGRPLLYRPMVFTTLERPAIGAGGVAAIVLASLLVCVLGTLGCLVVRRRKQLASLSLLGDDEAARQADAAETFSALVASPLQAGGAGMEDASLLPLFAQGRGAPEHVASPLAIAEEEVGASDAAPLVVSDVVAADPLAAVAPSGAAQAAALPLSEVAMGSDDDDDDDAGDADGGALAGDRDQLVQSAATDSAA